MATEEPPTPASHEKSPRKHSRLYTVMARHPEFICLLIFLLLNALSKYTKSYQPVLLDQPAPVRYFPSTSPVVDLFYGNLLDAADILYQDEILFVMYYAPWCAKCGRIRWEFEKAARYLENEVTFVGINCWYTDGSCRQQNKFSGFPVFFAYLAHFDGFKYDGIMTAEYMVKFLEQLKHPLTPLHTAAEVTLFMTNNDNAVIGFFDFNASPQPPGLQQFYCSAMRTLQMDPKNRIEFGVISSKIVAEKLNIRRSKTVIIARTNNETVKYPIFNNFTSSDLTEWVHLNQQKPSVKWLLPSGTKSLSLSSEINGGPAVVLFTQQRPIVNTNLNYNMLREIAVSYHDCENRSQNAHNHAFHGYQRWKSVSLSLQLAKECMALKQSGSKTVFPQNRAEPTWISSCYSFVNTLDGLVKSCEMCFHSYRKSELRTIGRESQELSDTKLMSLINQYFIENVSPQGCQVARKNFSPSEFISLCCDQFSVGYNADSLFQIKLDKSSGRRFTDPFVKKTVIKGIYHKCQKLRFSRAHGWTGKSPDANQLKMQEGFTNSITGLGCHTNKSINFYAMNIVQSHEFLERLGVPVVHRVNQSTVVIIDKKEKAQYVMKEEFTQQNVVNFINNFTHGSLNRNFRSTSNENSNLKDSLIKEVTSDTFHKIVMDDAKDVVLLFYAPWCGFCTGFAHVYLALARYFKDAKKVVFARINAERNDLPWEYKVEKYPTIILFPAARKSNSQAFPAKQDKTLPNLIQFVLRYSSKNVKRQIGLAKCSRKCMQQNIKKLEYRLQTLDSEIWILQRRINQVEIKMVQAKSFLVEVAIGTAGLNTDQEGKKITDTYTQINNYDVYINQLRLELCQKQLKYQNAFSVLSVLKQTDGRFIEEKNLHGILKRHSIYRNQLSKLTKQKDVFSSSQEWETHRLRSAVEHTSLGVRDEL